VLLCIRLGLKFCGELRDLGFEINLLFVENKIEFGDYFVFLLKLGSERWLLFWLA